ncbi:hypothetical protein JCM2811A_09600 [Methylorubrum rhodinum]
MQLGIRPLQARKPVGDVPGRPFAGVTIGVLTPQRVPGVFAGSFAHTLLLIRSAPNEHGRGPRTRDPATSAVRLLDPDEAEGCPLPPSAMMIV